MNRGQQGRPEMNQIPTLFYPHQSMCTLLFNFLASSLSVLPSLPLSLSPSSCLTSSLFSQQSPSHIILLVLISTEDTSLCCVETVQVAHHHWSCSCACRHCCSHICLHCSGMSPMHTLKMPHTPTTAFNRMCCYQCNVILR